MSGLEVELNEPMIETPNVEQMPDDPVVLKSKLREAYGQIAELAHALVQMRRHLFGRKSERLAEGQQIFEFAGTLESEPQQQPPDRPPRRREACTFRRRGRRIVPPEVPRVQVIYDVPDKDKQCENCRHALKEIGRDTALRMDYEGPKFTATIHIRPKYACGNCKDKIVVADPPLNPIARGLAGPGLLAQIVVAKYADGLPLYRQEGMYRRSGVNLPRATMCGWVGACAQALRPVYAALRRRVLCSHAVNSDDTPVGFLEPGHGQTRRGYVWGYLGDLQNPYVVYAFSRDHTKEHPKEFLKNYEGFLVCDAYKGYEGLFGSGKIVHVACWAHVRRYFFEAQDTDQTRARAALGTIGRLYDVERRATELELKPEDRRALREKNSVPLVEGFRKWLDEQLLAVLPKSPLGKAIQYARGQWDSLTRYLHDGRLPIGRVEYRRAS